MHYNHIIVDAAKAEFTLDITCMKALNLCYEVKQTPIFKTGSYTHDEVGTCLALEIAFA